jgi:hypothetical protein
LIDLLFKNPAGFRGGARLLALLLTVLAISGCQSLDNPGTNAILATAKGSLPFSGNPVDGAVLDPNIGFLRVTYDGNVALFALAFIDHNQAGEVTVYFGPERSVLKLQNGHVLSLLGTSLEWHSVKLSQNPVFPGAAGQNIERRRDVEPGERFDRLDHLTIARAAPEARALKGIDPNILTWYSESSSDLPPGRIATNSAGVPVYGEQWLDDGHLFTWQLWPVDRIHPLP